MLKFENVVFIDGITRAGKYWLANMLIHFDRMEHMQELTLADEYVHMNLRGLLTDKATIKLLRFDVGEHMCEMAMGRRINFRLVDSSSIYNNPNLQSYLQRIYGEDITRLDLEEKINKENRQFLFILHDILCNSRVFFEAFPRAKLIRIERNPIDLIYAWYKRGHGSITEHLDFEQLEGKSKPQPWWTYLWTEAWEDLNEIDRIIKSIASFSQMAEESFRNLLDIFKKRIIFTSYDFLATQARIEAEKISAFLDVKPMPSIESFFAQEVFKQRNKETLKRLRAERLLIIKEKASKDMFSLLLELNEQYTKSSF